MKRIPVPQSQTRAANGAPTFLSALRLNEPTSGANKPAARDCGAKPVANRRSVVKNHAAAGCIWSARLNSFGFLLFWNVTKKKKDSFILEKDQHWKLPEAHIKIINVGRHLTHFKHSKTLDQKRVSTQVETISEVQKYLKEYHGKLVKEQSSLKKAA